MRFHLTLRELEVLAYMAAGRSNREIADRLGITPATVRVHIFNLGWKLGAYSREEIVERAAERRLLEIRHERVVVTIPENPSQPKGWEQLTTRERQVLTELAIHSGMRNRDLAEHLSLSEPAIKKNLHSAYLKLGVPNRATAILCAKQAMAIGDHLPSVSFGVQEEA